jgi:hypothetical protein
LYYHNLPYFLLHCCFDKKMTHFSNYKNYCLCFHTFSIVIIRLQSMLKIKHNDYYYYSCCILNYYFLFNILNLLFHYFGCLLYFYLMNVIEMYFFFFIYYFSIFQ